MRRYAPLRQLTPAARGLLLATAALLALPLIVLLRTMLSATAGGDAYERGSSYSGVRLRAVDGLLAPGIVSLQQAQRAVVRRAAGDPQPAAYLQRAAQADMAEQLEKVRAWLLALDGPLGSCRCR
jgi:hypothetical protein